MNKKNYSRSNNVEKEQDSRQPRHTRGNTKKQYQRTRSIASIEERRWTSMETRQDSLYSRMNIHPK